MSGVIVCGAGGRESSDECGLIAAGIAIVIIPALNGVGTSLKVHDHQHLAEVIVCISGTSMSAIAS
jgi:hypothetical protein